MILPVDLVVVDNDIGDVTGALITHHQNHHDHYDHHDPPLLILLLILRSVCIIPFIYSRMIITSPPDLQVVADETADLAKHIG
jgi:hypothetical protein